MVLVLVLALAAAAEGVQPVGASTVRRFPVLTDPEFRDLWAAAQPLPGLDPVVVPPSITGHTGADARIRAIAERRGSRKQSTPTRALTTVDGSPVQPPVVSAWRSLQASARRAGHSLIIRSSYRSVATQRSMFLNRLRPFGYSNEQIARGNADAAVESILQWLAAPGYSRHHTGYALDIAVAGQTSRQFGGTAAFRWLSANNYAAAKAAGFIPSYPKNGAPQGAEFEPWEISFVGTATIECAVVHLPGLRDQQPTACNRPLVWHSRPTATPGAPGSSAVFGRIFDVPLTGDWDASVGATPGVARRSGAQLAWHLRNSMTSGPGTASFVYGRSGDRPLSGDWDGDGGTDIGVVQVEAGRLRWALRDAASAGRATRVLVFGRYGDVPVTGDWDGDGKTDIGVVRSVNGRLTWYLRPATALGAVQHTVTYGRGGDRPVVGDWDGDGRDTIGVVRADAGRQRWLLRDALAGGAADRSFLYGLATDGPLAASWTGGATGIAVVRS